MVEAHVAARLQHAGNLSSRVDTSSFIAETRLTNTDYLSKNRVYAKLGETVVLEAEPSVLHFGAFTVGKTCKQIIRIRNKAGYSCRVHVLPPATPFFRIVSARRYGSIPPGLAEEVEVEFCAQEWRYHYDSIRIHAEEENLVIPLHAYPVTNEMTFPSRLDFGKCAIGTIATKTVKLGCTVPVEFEFCVEHVRANPRFQVSPSKGMVPASGDVTFTVTFSPNRFATEEATVKIKVAEFNSEPKDCILVGSGAPGLAFETVIQASLSPGTLPYLDKTLGGRVPDASTQQTWGRDLQRGSTARDPYSTKAIQLRLDAAKGRDCRRDGPIESRPPKQAEAPPDQLVDWVYMPNSLSGHAPVSYILGQQQGKLRTQDIKGAIEDFKQTQSKEQQALEDVLEAGRTASIHPLNSPSIPDTIKAKVFVKQLQEAEAAEQVTGVNTCRLLGQEVLSADAVEQAQAARCQAAADHQASIEQEACHRLRCQTDGGGGPTVMPSTSGSTKAADLHGWQPSWQVAAANTWRKRTHMAQRFIQAARKVIYQLRMQQRLDKLKHLRGAVSGSTDAASKQLASAIMQQASSMQRPGAAPTSLYDPAKVRFKELPLFREFNFPDFGPVQCSTYDDYDDLQPLQLQLPVEYQQLGYAAEDLPDYTPYAPPNQQVTMMDGAHEECLQVPPASVAPDVQQLPAMPGFLLPNVYVSYEVSSRYFNNEVHTVPTPAWGRHQDSSIQPQIYPYHNSTTHDDASSSTVRALHGQPTIADSWLPKRQGPEFVLQACPDVSILLTGPESVQATQPTASTSWHQPQRTADIDISTLIPADTTATSDAGSSTQSTSGFQVAGSTFELPRAVAHTALDTTKVQSRLATVQANHERLESYNHSLTCPSKHKLQL